MTVDRDVKGHAASIPSLSDVNWGFSAALKPDLSPRLYFALRSVVHCSWSRLKKNIDITKHMESDTRTTSFHFLVIVLMSGLTYVLITHEKTWLKSHVCHHLVRFAFTPQTTHSRVSWKPDRMNLPKELWAPTHTPKPHLTHLARVQYLTLLYPFLIT